MATIYEDLRLLCGSHVKAARAIGISVSEYRGLRSGRLRLNRIMESYIRQRYEELLKEAGIDEFYE